MAWIVKLLIDGQLKNSCCDNSDTKDGVLIIITDHSSSVPPERGTFFQGKYKSTNIITMPNKRARTHLLIRWLLTIISLCL
ncbi:unnamed protein product [Larinioides sclopetarius]|uniref:Uncharacterized protein n=1 Tax=Larinioides sclopetarius TaxID=280406 RepID=A0AAV2AFG9_9ARAC